MELAWNMEYGKDQFVILMGGHHIEICVLNIIGHWLEDSGWSYVMAAANIKTEGRADAIQKGNETSRGQWAYQITLAALYHLRKEAYQVHIDETDRPRPMAFEEWCDHMDENHPQFSYWNKTLKLLVLFLQFLKSIREADFIMYRSVLRKLVPWMFGTDHFNYARWISIQLQDLNDLEKTCPNVHREFFKGNLFYTEVRAQVFSVST